MLESPSKVGVLENSQVVLAFLIDVFFFKVKFNNLTLFGSILICCSNFYMTYFNKKWFNIVNTKFEFKELIFFCII